MKRNVMRSAAIAGAIVATACVEYAPVSPSTTTRAETRAVGTPNMQTVAAAAAPSSDRYLVVFKPGRNAGPDISTELSANGGLLEGLHANLGFAVVSGISPDAAARLAKSSGVASVEADVEFTIESAAEAEALDVADAGIESATAPQTAALFARQWNMRAISANLAWARGALGSSDVSVAILDTGIDYRWPDLVGRVDLTRSISLRPDEDARLNTWFGALHLHPITDLNAHGTLVSSIVASNSGFFAGVTTRTTLFGVKVCIVFNSCSTAAILNGIVYAVNNGADVINMSLGGAFLKSANPGFVSVINSVFNYANRNGTLIVVAAGNEAADIDHDGNIYRTYCNSPHVVCVSATGPTAAPTSAGPFTNPDAFAPYSNYGRSAISLAAPGGGVTTANAFVTGPCSQTSLAWHQPPPPAAPVIDGPLCPAPGLFLLRGAGTSFASPHVAGVAAAMVPSVGHDNPSQLRARLQQSADDLGDAGTDPLYGKGRLNGARAVGAIP